MSMLPRKNKHYGFTLVELCVVMMVMGILAGLVIVGVNSWRTSAARKEVQSDLNGVVAGMNAARAFNNGYPLSLPSSFTASPNVQLSYVSGDASNYCIDGKSKVATSANYFIDTARTGGEPRFGTCAMGELALDTPLGPGWDGAITGTAHKCALASGKPYCWGSNAYGQLGNNTYVSSTTPVPVDVSGALNGKTITAIEAASQATCAIADGSVYCWGRNDKRQLGAAAPSDSKVPLAMNALHPSGV
ncbi:MAG: prepilin-type N-terminal cleavage/methylation domain-containing protein, partial [Candidatus Saccharimonadales bacterium]